MKMKILNQNLHTNINVWCLRNGHNIKKKQDSYLTKFNKSPTVDNPWLITLRYSPLIMGHLKQIHSFWSCSVIYPAFRGCYSNITLLNFTVGSVGHRIRHFNIKPCFFFHLLSK